MRIAMFEGYAGVDAAIAARRRRLSGFGELSSDQLRMADDALTLASANRSAWEFWKPSVAELQAMRGWLGDPRVGNATINVYLSKAHDAMGESAWRTFISTWASQVNEAQAAADKVADQYLPSLPKIAGDIGSVGKWVVIGVVALAVINVVSVLPKRK